MSAEAQGFVPKPKEVVDQPKPLDVVRVFPWVIAMADKVAQDLRIGEEPDLIRVLLSQKSDNSKISPLKLTPIGGARRSEKHEDKMTAAYRETREETTITLFPYNPLVGEGSSNIFRSKKNFTYSIKPPEGLDITDEQKVSYLRPRRVSLVSLPALPPRIAKGHFPNDQKDNLERIVPLPVSQLAHVFKEGEHEGVPIVGHCSKRESGDTIRIIGEEKAKRNSQLDELVKFLNGVNQRIKEDLLRRLRCEHVSTLLEAYERLLLEHEGDEDGAYTQLKNSLDSMRLNMYAEYFRAVEKQGNGKNGNISHGANGVEGNVSHDGDGRLKRHANILRESFSHGSRGTEILHLLPLYTQSDVIKAKTTKSSVAFEEFLFELFDKSVDKVSPTDQEWEESKMIKLFLPSGESLPIHQRVDFAEKLQKAALEEIAQLFNLSSAYVDQVWHETQRFFPEFGKIVRSENNILQDKIRQAHELRNEVSNAGLPELIVRYMHDPESLIRFEAGRQLFIFLKILFEKERYDELVDKGNEPFRFAVEEFFGRRDMDRREISIRGRPYPLRKTEKYMTLVDQKPEKDIISYIRVATEKSSEDINDIFAYSIVLWNSLSNGERTADGTTSQINKTQEMIGDFLTTLKTNYYPEEEGFKVEVLNDHADALGRFIKYKKRGVSQAELQQLSGKRTGSMGDFIVRRKMLVKITKPDGQDYMCEFAFYPFAQLDAESVNAGFMGWEEKLQDDSKYTLRRIVNQLKGAQGLQSLYELFFPSHFYPFVADWVKTAIAADEKLSI